MPEHRLVDGILHRQVKILLNALDDQGVARCQLFAAIDSAANEAEDEVSHQ
jgi:hypothetical protein